MLRTVVRWEVCCIQGRVGALMDLDCGHQVAARVDPSRLIEVGYTRARCYECARAEQEEASDA